MIIKFDPFRVKKDEPILHEDEVINGDEILIPPPGENPEDAPPSGGAPS